MIEIDHQMNGDTTKMREGEEAFQDLYVQQNVLKAKSKHSQTDSEL